MRESYDIVIVGGGLIGATLAMWLSRNTSLSLAVIERGEQILEAAEANQRVVALGTAGTQLLSEVGVFSQLGAAHAHAYQRMLIWDENSHGELEFKADDVDLPELGYMVDSLKCVEILQRELARDEGVDVRFDCSAEALNLSAGKAELDAGEQTIRAELVVAADGINSWVRRQAKIFANQRAFGQSGIVATITTEKSHQDCAWQRFLSTGPVAVLPLSNNQSSIVWSADASLATELMALPDAKFAQALSDALDNRLGHVSMLGRRQAFPLRSVRAERYFRRNIVLLGDAAHSIHPLAGQGANLGFKDLRCLGQLLRNAERGELGSPRLLSRFERARRVDNEQTDRVMTLLNTAYQTNTPLWSVLRGAGMNWLRGTSAVRNVLARQAMGL